VIDKMKKEDIVVRVALATTSKRTIQKFKKGCRQDGTYYLDIVYGERETLFKLLVPTGKRIVLPCKGEVNIWRHCITC